MQAVDAPFLDTVWMVAIEVKLYVCLWYLDLLNSELLVHSGRPFDLLLLIPQWTVYWVQMAQQYLLPAEARVWKFYQYIWAT